MSYDLAVWEGPRPLSNKDAAETYVSMHRRWQGEGVTRADPTPLIKELIDVLVERWPDEDDDSPWSDGPIIGNATGPYFYFGVIFSMAEEAATFVAEQAERLGLVCFDPQASALIPDLEAPPPRPPAEPPKRRLFRRN